VKGLASYHQPSETALFLPPDPSFCPEVHSFLLIKSSIYGIAFSFLFFPHGIPSARHDLPVGKEREMLIAKFLLF